MPEEELRVPERHFDGSSKAFQSRDKGQIIKSKRKFGVEIEMFHSKRKAIHDLYKGISSAFGFEHDGSIEARGANAIEVVSPIMQGSLGETGVKDLFLRANKLGFSVNKTCGLHVHLDGKDFSKTDKTFIAPIEILDGKLLSGMKPDDYGFIITLDVLQAITSRSSMSSEEVARLLMDEYISTRNRRIFLSKALGTNIPEITIKECSLTVGKTKVMVDMYCLAKPSPSYEELNGKELTRLIPAQDDLFCVIYNNKNLKNVLTLLYLHTVFGDVFMSMLPKSRRQDNLYCQQLSLGFSAGQIENIESFTELESAWYKTKTAIDVQRRKGNKYDDSRYFSINLHSLFAKYGTIEVRSHSATLDPSKVLYWVAFHQEILDNIVAGKISISSLSKGTHLFHIEDKTAFLIKAMQLRAPLRTYMQQRIDYFRNNETNK